MKVDKALNLVVPIYGDEVPKLDAQGKPIMVDGKPVMIEPVVAYVHSTPVSRETFERYFLEISQTFSAIYSQGLGMAAGPRIALLLLKRVAEQNNNWSGENGVQALVEEIRRLTVVIVREGAGWQPVPLKIAADRGIIAPDDMAEVENAIVFFIVASAMHRRAERRPILQGAADLWGAQISSSNSTEFASSLPTSTGTASSGEKPPASAPAPSGPANAVVDGKPASLPV